MKKYVFYNYLWFSCLFILKLFLDSSQNISQTVEAALKNNSLLSGSHVSHVVNRIKSNIVDSAAKGKLVSSFT